MFSRCRRCCHSRRSARSPSSSAFCAASISRRLRRSSSIWRSVAALSSAACQLWPARNCSTRRALESTLCCLLLALLASLTSGLQLCVRFVDARIAPPQQVLLAACRDQLSPQPGCSLCGEKRTRWWRRHVRPTERLAKPSHACRGLKAVAGAQGGCQETASPRAACEYRKAPHSAS